ncbi:MAG TPA: patatin-like phospholipase family protein [Vicinamibacterales bacterium]|nr:patatin-like phospholipase family protein [Vicinamibacterales bacterium]
MACHTHLVPRRAVRARLLGTLVAMALLCPGPAHAQTPAPQSPAPQARVGVALGGGSARGLAHVGVLRWLEEHRIPVELIAGTSMGGLVGGAYATGMTPDDLEALLSQVNWDSMFGSNDFQYLSVRRKRDARSYPSYLEFGLRGGLIAPPSLNSGQQVEFLLARITAPYYRLASFDDLPTPFRCVAVDLRTARAIVLENGSLAQAMRATMSIPLVFPPVADGAALLVDGGALNNVPADVVRAMGATRVIAVNVGELGDNPDIDYSMLGLAGQTVDAMMRAATLRALASADVVINVPLKKYGSLDWRRYTQLFREGYDAADAMRDQLLPFAVDEPAFRQWQAARSAKRLIALPVVAFVNVEGAAANDTDRIRAALAPSVGQPLDTATIETRLAELSVLERYETMNWELATVNGQTGLVVRARAKSYGPPFMFIGVSLENTTSNDFRFSLAGRYLAYDVLGSGNELRIDASIGSDPSVGASLYKPLGSSNLFVEAGGGIESRTLNVIEDNHVSAAYRQTRAAIAADFGANLGRLDEARLGLVFGHLDASPRIGDPGLPAIKGPETVARLMWTHDSQDSPVVPTRGAHIEATLEYFLDAPGVPEGIVTDRSSKDVTRLSAGGSWLHSIKQNTRYRLFVAGGAGTAFDGKPLPTEQFALGGPLRLGAFSVGEVRGDHFVQATGGYLQQVFRLPDLIGGPLLAGGWLETGSAFNSGDEFALDTHVSAGLIAETLIGPVFGAVSVGFDGSKRFYLGIGRIFR